MASAVNSSVDASPPNKKGLPDALVVAHSSSGTDAFVYGVVRSAYGHGETGCTG